MQRGNLWLLTLLGGFIGMASLPAVRAEPPILRIGLEDEPSTLDWNRARSPSERFVASFLMRGLLKYDPSGRPVCDLCRTFQVLNGGKTYRFEIPSDIPWADGTPLEASHFVDGFQRLLQPSHPHPVASDFEAIAGTSTKRSIRAVNKATLEIELKRPVATFTHRLTQVPTYPYRPGTSLGPYLLAAWEKGKRIVIEGNPLFTQDRPVYRVEFVLGSHVELTRRFSEGKIDVLANPTTEDAMKYPSARMQVSQFWATRTLVFNTRKNPMASASMRKSILMVLDRSALPALLKNGEKAATGLIPPGLSGFNPAPPVSAGLEQIQAERHRAVGWPQWVDLELLLRDTPLEKAVARWLGEQLSKIHIRLRTKAQRASDFYSDLEAGRFDLALETLTFETASSLDAISRFHSKNGKNWGAWSNSAFDTLLDQALTSEKGEEAAESLLKPLRDALETQDPALVPLTFPAHGFLLNSRVKSFAMTPFGDPDLLKIDLKAQSGQRK